MSIDHAPSHLSTPTIQSSNDDCDSNMSDIFNVSREDGIANISTLAEEDSILSIRNQYNSEASSSASQLFRNDIFPETSQISQLNESKHIRKGTIKRRATSRLKKTFTFRSKRIHVPKKVPPQIDIDSLQISNLHGSPRRFNDSSINSSIMSKRSDQTMNESIDLMSSSFKTTDTSLNESRQHNLSIPSFTGDLTPVNQSIRSHQYLTRSAYSNQQRLLHQSATSSTPALDKENVVVFGAKSSRRKLHTLIKETVHVTMGTIPTKGIVMREDAGHTPKPSRKKNKVEIDERLI